MGASIKLNRKDFSKSVEDLVINKKLTYIDAILQMCEKNEIEPDTVKKLITKPIKEKLQIEGQVINILPKNNCLPLV